MNWTLKVGYGVSESEFMTYKPAIGLQGWKEVLETPRETTDSFHLGVIYSKEIFLIDSAACDSRPEQQQSLPAIFEKTANLIAKVIADESSRQRNVKCRHDVENWSPSPT